VGLLVSPYEPRWLRALLKRLIRHQAYHPHHSLVSARVVDRERAKGRIVTAWAPMDHGEVERLLGLGLDGIMTGAPDLALELRDRLRHKNGHNALSTRAPGS
jgi:glycerophosphoryl diester phosphodiesterase